MLKALASQPIFFEQNRVFRVYTGGMLLGKFLGREEADGNRPEEWIASSVSALNSGAATQDGISVVKGTDVTLTQLLAEEQAAVLGGRSDFGALIKFLDSAIRLPVQAHPNKAFAARHFHSPYGKTEAWLVLGTREGAGVYFGFKDGVTESAFRQAAAASETDPAAMARLLQFVPVQKGDVFLVPANVAHAVGEGCLILEIQEPTDFTIQPEAWCGEYHLNEYEMYLGLAPDIAIECFDFTISGEHALRIGKKTPVTLRKSGTCRVERLIGPEDTDCFALNRYTVTAGKAERLRAPSVIVVTEGSGMLVHDRQVWEIRQGDYFLLPACLDGKCAVATWGKIEFAECLPPAG